MPDFSKETADSLAKRFLNEFPKKSHNLVMTFSEPGHLLLIGADNFFSDLYFVIVKPNWVNGQWQLKRWALNQYQLKDLQKLLHMFSDTEYKISYIRNREKKLIVGDFSLTVENRKGALANEWRIIILFGSDEILDMSFRTNNVQDLLNTILFLDRDRVFLGIHNVLVLSDLYTHVFSHIGNYKSIEARQYGNSRFDCETQTLEIEMARNTLKNNSHIVNMRSPFREYFNDGTCSWLNFGFWQGVGFRIFVQRIENK